MAELALTWFMSPRTQSPFIKGVRKSCVQLPKTPVIRSQNRRSPSTRFSGGRRPAASTNSLVIFGIAVVGKPIDQRPDRREFPIIGYRRKIERPDLTAKTWQLRCDKLSSPSSLSNLRIGCIADGGVDFIEICRRNA